MMSGDQPGAMGNMQGGMQATPMAGMGDSHNQGSEHGNMQGGMQATPMAGMGDSHSHGSEYGSMAVSAAYMVLVNNGPADAIVKAESDVAKSVELHNVIMENNVMQMRQVEAIEVPANGQVELKPGGYHVMLIGLNRDLKEGEEVLIKLTTRSGQTIEVKAPVRKP
jgi:copper(I)-binding protein